MNPWIVLGIDATSDVRSIKQAYATLLKQTRPEEDPEGYQLLREAYDRAVDLASAEAVEPSDAAASEPFYDTASSPVATPPGADANEPATRDHSEQDEWEQYLNQMQAFLDEIDSQLKSDDPFNEDAWQALLKSSALASIDSRRDLSSPVFLRVALLCRDVDQDDNQETKCRSLIVALDEVFDWQGTQLQLSQLYEKSLLDAVMQRLLGDAGVSANRERPDATETRNPRKLVVTLVFLSIWFGVAITALSRCESDEEVRTIQVSTDPDFDAVWQADRAVEAGALATAEGLYRDIADGETRYAVRAAVALYPLLHRLGKEEEAESHLQQTLARDELHPRTEARLLVWRADSLAREGKRREAQSDLLRAVELAAGRETLSAVAWELATTPLEDLRDPPRALDFARQLIQFGSLTAAELDTVAAAYAAVKEFTLATDMELRAIDELGDDIYYVPGFTERLRLYQRRLPYVDRTKATETKIDRTAFAQ